MTSAAVTNRKTEPEAIVLGFWFSSLTAGQHGDKVKAAAARWGFPLLTEIYKGEPAWH